MDGLSLTNDFTISCRPDDCGSVESMHASKRSVLVVEPSSQLVVRSHYGYRGMKFLTRKKERRKTISCFGRRSVSKSEDTIARINDLIAIGKALEYLENFHTIKIDLLVVDIRVNCVTYPMRRLF